VLLNLQAQQQQTLLLQITANTETLTSMMEAEDRCTLYHDNRQCLNMHILKETKQMYLIGTLFIKQINPNAANAVYLTGYALESS